MCQRKCCNTTVSCEIERWPMTMGKKNSQMPVMPQASNMMTLQHDDIAILDPTDISFGCPVLCLNKERKKSNSLVYWHFQIIYHSTKSTQTFVRVFSAHSLFGHPNLDIFPTICEVRQWGRWTKAQICLVTQLCSWSKNRRILLGTQTQVWPHSRGKWSRVK